MSLEKSLRKAFNLDTSLQKKEDPEAYKKLASTGFLLAHPVKIKGESHRPDNGIGYHASIKFFDKENDNADRAHKTASQLEMHPPNPKEVEVEPKVLKDRNGNDVYAIGLKGKAADKIKEHHDKFSHMGHKENYKWGAHISVPKAIHDEIKKAGHKTAHDAGIEFGHAELKRGPKTLKVYKPKEEKLAASESEALEKGALRNILTAGAMAGALASPATATNAPPKLEPAKAPTSLSSPKALETRGPASLSSPENSGYSREKMMNAISQIESSGGKNMAHKPTSHGTAFGKWALMPDTIKETIKLNPDLKRQHQKALNLQGDDLNHYMQDNPNLEHDLVDRHLKRLEHHFGQNPEKIAFGWNQGISGTNKALRQKTDIGSHPYVQKFKQAYKGDR